jgi:peptidoglycan/xylan/chitin deacetylase (PgdA/CDA1 family)
MKAGKPLASLSLDLDDLWTYLRTRGDPGWEARPSYLPTFVPLALDLFDRLELQITVFVVGADAVRTANLPYLRAIADRGHEIGNHSFSHECWLHLHTASELEGEIVRAEEAISEATGQRPTGFRGPGFSWSPELLEALSRRGYLYDASTLPTFLGPAARWYFLARSGLSPEERDRRATLFGAFRDGFRPVRPYRWQLRGGSQLLEIPVTTLPIVKLPFHMSYLLYLSQISHGLMFAYLRTAISVCRAARVQPTFLLHPLDLLDAEQAPGLSFFPAMGLPGVTKRDLVAQVLRLLAKSFRLVPMEQHAGAILAAGRVPERVPAFA